MVDFRVFLQLACADFEDLEQMAIAYGCVRTRCVRTSCVRTRCVRTRCVRTRSMKT